MRSQLDVRLGEQVPQILHSPPGVVSLDAAEEAIELADAYGVCDGNPLAESQKITLRGAMGERADGSWAASRVADFGPRQGTGKSDKIAVRELAGLVLFGEKLLIHTAHEFPTANECFLRLVGLFENWDDLRKKVARIRYANGEQGIELLSGQRLKYRARTGGSGRGFAKADLVVYDEAQHLGREHLAASGPSKLANPNSQTWYAGSGGLPTSHVAWAIRRDALSGDAGRLAYTEMTAEKVSLVDGKIRSVRPDPYDVASWYQAMPGLGRWVTEESMRALLEEMGPDLFARECECVWDRELGDEGESIISAEEWASLVARSTAADPVALAFDVTPDRSSATIAAAGASTAEGHRVHVEVVKQDRGTGWVVPLLVQLAVARGPVAIVCDPAGPAGGLLSAAAAAGVEVTPVSAREHAQACGGLLDAVKAGDVSHIGQVPLSAAVAGAATRDLGDGAWLWSRKSSDVDISPLVAVTLAKWAWENAPVPEATASVY